MWRKKGPLGKLHNINTWINATEQRLQKFLAYSHNRRIPRDNSTRWNSWQRQIYTATQGEMMEAIDQFLDTFGDSRVALDRLHEGDWEMLDKINAMLSVLMEATKTNSLCDNPGARISTKEKPTGKVLYYRREY